MLTMVATPIGNYQDITLRSIELLNACDIIIGEEFRVTSTLLKKIGITQNDGKSVDHKIHLLNEHSTPKDVAGLLELCKTKNVALITDCGTPVFSDPGADLIRECRKNNVSVTVAPGASALMALISLSSRKLERFLFMGFLPANKDERVQALNKLKNEKHSWIIMDTPYRFQALLADLAQIMPNERALLGMNLTCTDERVLEGTFKQLKSLCEGTQNPNFMILRYEHGV